MLQFCRIMTKIQRLKKLEDQFIKDRVCQNLADQANNLIMGEGSSDAEIMFIGEAPGKKEDETGKPFVGASGQMLNILLESIQLSREVVYITNIVKYRPPKNRDPLDSEKEEMWPYLVKQINIIKPKLIVTLGRHSGSEFLKGLIIGEAHGKLMVDKRGWSILPLYHPAAAMYNGSLRQTLFDDFAEIPKILKLIN